MSEREKRGRKGGEKGEREKEMGETPVAGTAQ